MNELSPHASSAAHGHAAGYAGFVHLRVHSAYSLSESTLRLNSLAELAAADHQPAVAITDSFNLFGAFEFSQKMNLHTSKDAFLFPDMQDLLHQAPDVTVFSRIDFKAAYHQSPLDPKDIAFTAFAAIV